MTGHLSAPAQGCPVCGGCQLTLPPHPIDYPFLPGGFDPMAGQDFVIAPHRIVDEELCRVVYGEGDFVPMADAVKYGLVKASKAAKKPAVEEPKRGARRRTPAEDRAHRPAEDR
jgi:hypothetical protein